MEVGERRWWRWRRPIIRKKVPGSAWPRKSPIVFLFAGVRGGDEGEGEEGGARFEARDVVREYGVNDADGRSRRDDE